MGRVGREIGAIGPEVCTFSTGRIVVDGDTGGEDFTEGEAEGDVLVGGGIRFVVAVLPIEQYSAAASLRQRNDSSIGSLTTETQSNPREYSLV